MTIYEKIARTIHIERMTTNNIISESMSKSARRPQKTEMTQTDPRMKHALRIRSLQRVTSAAAVDTKKFIVSVL